MLLNCASCPCTYSVGAGRCPECGGAATVQQNVALDAIPVEVGAVGKARGKTPKHAGAPRVFAGQPPASDDRSEDAGTTPAE